MIIYTRTFNASLGQFKQSAVEMEVTWRSSIDTAANLPTSDNVEQDVRYVIDSNHLYVYLNGAWLDQGAFDVMDIVEERLMQGLS